MSVSVIVSDLVLIILSVALFIHTADFRKNKDFMKNIIITLSVGVIFCIISFFGPELVFPFQALALIFMIYTDFSSAVCLLGMFGTISMIACNESSGYFFYSFFTGLILLVYLKNPEKNFDIKKAVFYYSLSSIVIYTALFIIYSINITPEKIIFPFVGIMMNSLLTVIVMPKLAHGFLFKTEEKYRSIVDPEFHLLLRLKKENKFEYKRAIHTAYLSGRCSDRIGADNRMTRGCAFYHRIGVLVEGDDNIAVKTARLIDEDDFPEELSDKIKICAGAKKEPLPKEAAIAQICDELVVSIMKVMEEKKNENINYDSLIDLIFERLANRAPVMDSDLSLRDLRNIKKKLKEEKLYYDFLR